eukprot:scaffold2526_cov131-Cylindrotheca_fusiformis.AAC.9
MIKIGAVGDISCVEVALRNGRRYNKRRLMLGRILLKAEILCLLQSQIWNSGANVKKWFLAPLLPIAHPFVATAFSVNFG